MVVFEQRGDPSPACLEVICDIVCEVLLMKVLWSGMPCLISLALYDKWVYVP